MCHPVRGRKNTRGVLGFGAERGRGRSWGRGSFLALGALGLLGLFAVITMVAILGGKLDVNAFGVERRSKTCRYRGSEKDQTIRRKRTRKEGRHGTATHEYVQFLLAFHCENRTKDLRFCRKNKKVRGRM